MIFSVQNLSTQPSKKVAFWLFAALTSLHMLLITWGFFDHAVLNFAFNFVGAFNVLSWVGYSIIYTLIALIPLCLAIIFVHKHSKIIAILAVALSTAALQFMRADLMIYDLYNFHFNGFVWNLVTTQGGLSSLGGGNDTYVSIAISVLLTIATQYALWLLSRKIAPRINLRWQTIAWFLIPIMLANMLMYGISDVRNDGQVLDAALAYPFYKKVTFRGAAEKMGFKALRTNSNKLSVDTSRLQYPLAEVEFAPVLNPPNIVILVAESLRWDRLTSEIMPNTWALAQKGQYYTQHYSSGNGTREALFGMFYGLYGSYWSSFLHAQKSPLLMDKLQELGYQLDIRTSASFTYPEFNKTLFAKIPLAQLHEEPESKKPWERDRDNATGLIDFVKNRDKTKPFMSFFFFESTHARYDFPDTNIIAEPYLKDVNYWGMSRKSLAPKIGELKNRYTNAAHWVDIQLGRIYADLEAQGLLENTIIIVTGDHGEEFLEKGFWGHNSTFVEEQTHTPMVIIAPTLGHAEISRVTSHLDISPTLLQAIGAPKDAQSYSLGTNILVPTDRKFVVISDWHSIGVMTDDMKYRIPYASKGFDHWQPTDLQDKALSSDEASSALAKNQTSILQAIKNSSKFLVNKNK